MKSSFCTDIKNVFDSLNEYVRYAHFKSNMHLDASVNGETDFDILVDRQSQEEFVSIMLVNNFVRMKTAVVNSYEAVEDWIGFSVEHSCLIHFHVHWEFVVGQPHVKQYSIPIAQRVLEDTKIVSIGGVNIRTVSPEMELQILVIRSLLKFRKRELPRILLNKRILAPDFDAELAWLDTQTLGKKISEQNLYYSSLEITQVLSLIENNSVFRYLLCVISYRKCVKDFLILNTIEVLMSRYWNEFCKRLLPRIFFVHRTVKRSPQAGGLSMHLVGIDGAGKSSLQASLHKMLGKKLDVRSVYFGLGSGKKSWHRAILEIGRRKSTRVQSIGTSNTSHSGLGLVKKIKRAVYAVSVATEKRSKLKQVIALRSMGFIVICDRYPQLQSIGLNDGYILDDQNFSYGIWKLFYNLERKIMSVFERYYCDVLFFMEISAETAYDRKREESIDILEQKRHQLTKIVESDSRARRTVSLDSGASPSRLTYEVVSVIWKYLK
jgi:hypothetical protein